MLDETRIEDVVRDALWKYRCLIVDPDTRGEISAYCSLYHICSVLGAHVNPGDDERFERYSTLMQKLLHGSLTVAWAHWYLLVWYRGLPNLTSHDLARAVRVSDVVFAGWSNDPFKCEVLAGITNKGMQFGYEHHAGWPERARKDETLVRQIAKHRAEHYF